LLGLGEFHTRIVHCKNNKVIVVYIEQFLCLKRSNSYNQGTKAFELQFVPDNPM